MICVVSLGSKFSGGGIVLHDIIAATAAKSLKVEVVQPPQAGTKRLQRLLQILWILFWPLRVLAMPAPTVLVAHSLFLLSPFVFVLRKRKLFFLFQGEEYRALRSSIAAHTMEQLLKVGFRRFQCITTNDYLSDVARYMGGRTLPIKISLGPKRQFFQLHATNRSRRHVVVFARDGYNKGLDDALQVARLIGQELAVQFIAPEEVVAARLRAQGFNCMISVDPAQVCEQLRDAAALFLPSHYEGLSLPMLEALAVGTPVVTYAEGFPRFYSRLNCHVRFVEGRDATAACQQLIELSNNQAYSTSGATLIDGSRFSFEAYCDEVAAALASSVATPQVAQD